MTFLIASAGARAAVRRSASIGKRPVMSARERARPALRGRRARSRIAASKAARLAFTVPSTTWFLQHQVPHQEIGVDLDRRLAAGHAGEDEDAVGAEHRHHLERRAARRRSPRRRRRCCRPAPASSATEVVSADDVVSRRCRLDEPAARAVGAAARVDVGLEAVGDAAPSRRAARPVRRRARRRGGSCRALARRRRHAHGRRCWTCPTCVSAFSAMVSGSTSTPTSRSARGTTFM